MLTSLREAVRRNELALFFILAYAICAATFLTYAALPDLPFVVGRIIWWTGVFSPTISALIVAGAAGGFAEVGRLLAGFTRWRIGWQWYLAASILVLGPLLIALIYIALGNPPAGPAPDLLGWSIAGALLSTLCAGPLGEEAGWRGFALPRMEARLSSLGASVLLGILWAGWHLPQYAVPNNTMIPFPIFIPICVCLAIFFTWLYNNTGGSLIATVVAHFCFNFSGAWLAGYLGLAPAMVINVAGGIGIALIVVAVVVFAGARYLSRKSPEQLPFRRAEASYS